MEARQLNRKLESGILADKSNNKLIALPGCPGIGKSTFMVHFPDSDAYQGYVQEISDVSPIVSPISFNSAMGGNGTCFGLRILYGTAACMVISGTNMKQMSTWSDFYTIFGKYKDMSAPQAISLLRKVYGELRRLLLIVDEISKAKIFKMDVEDELVMRQIGVVLDTDSNTDVLVSALSPQYINTLVSNSNRGIEYCILHPLLDANVGKEACQVWAAEIMEGTKSRERFQYRVLESTHLLASGHPRTLQRVIEALKSKSQIWNDVSQELRQSPTAASVLTLLGRSVDVISEYGLGNPKRCFEMALSWTPHSPNEEVEFEFRKFIENGSLFLISTPERLNFLCAMRLSSFLKELPLIASLDSKERSPALQASVNLFRDFFAAKYELAAPPNISTCWERAVALTIVTRSISANSGSNIFGSLRGSLIGCSKSTTNPQLTSRVALDEASMKNIKCGEVVMSPHNYRGFDAVVFYLRSMIYFDAKITLPSSQSRLKIYCRARNTQYFAGPPSIVSRYSFVSSQYDILRVVHNR